MNNKTILSKEYSRLKNSKKINDDYINQREVEYQETKNKINEDNSVIKEYKCIYCNSDKVAISNSNFMGSKIDLDTKMVKFYCNTCNLNFYLRWEDLL
jgi:transcription elongation factor Elf1